MPQCLTCRSTVRTYRRIGPRKAICLECSLRYASTDVAASNRPDWERENKFSIGGGVKYRTRAERERKMLLDESRRGNVSAQDALWRTWRVRIITPGG